jgi:drug/metabolite transporter (DMT)-like permease
MQSPGLKPYLWMLCGCGWFAAMVILIGLANDHVAWQTVAVFRAAIAALFATAIALGTRAKLTIGTPILWVRSVAGSLSMVTSFYALTHLPGSDVLVVTNTFPMWVALLSWPAFGERPTLGVLAAVLAAVAGVAVCNKLEFSQFEPAHVAAIVASAFTAVAMMGLNRVKGVSSMGVVVHFSWVSVAFCSMTYLMPPKEGEVKPLLPAEVVHWVELLGVGATATVGQIFLTKAFRGGQATKVSVVGLSQVVMVMVWEGVFGGREFNAWQLVGTVLVLGPTAYVMIRERRVRPPSPPAGEGLEVRGNGISKPDDVGITKAPAA